MRGTEEFEPGGIMYTSLVIRAQSVPAAALLHGNGVFNSSDWFVVEYAAADSPALEELVASPVGTE
ncbi:hypothetical protein BDK88_3993 [Natrinema hispanicum]|uniref:Uncharacterized protein n=2 Tax=Natrinema hispanicum TaxID=392421 RepID=A0A482Y508_9EURY|nr:hypothetical protein BDK88_3993 [Natrinema hispanicum]